MQSTAQQVIDAVQAHNYALAIVLALVASVTFVRKIAPLLHGPTGAFLNSKRGGSLLVLVGGAAGAVVTALVAGQHLSWALALGATMTAAAASGGWNIVRDLLGISSATPSAPAVVVAPPAPAEPAPLPPAPGDDK